jgi:DNA polymerase-3 subunit gamma/tau
MLVETMLVRFALMDRTVSLEEVLRGLGPNDGSGERDGRAPARPVPPRVPAPAPARTPPSSSASPAPPPVAERPPISVAALRERWESILARLRADGRLTLVAALEHAMPTEVSVAGEITFELAPDFGHMEMPISNGARDLLTAIGAVLEGATRVVARVPAAPPREGSTKRLTAEAMKAERLSSLRRKDPSLDAAVRELDLELMD